MTIQLQYSTHLLQDSIVIMIASDSLVKILNIGAIAREIWLVNRQR